MKATGVLARLVPLLDVTLILLGLLMIVLTQAKMSPGEATSLTEPQLDVIFLYAGWEGPRKGRVYQLGVDGVIGPEVRSETTADINKLKSSEGRKPAFVLVLDAEGWLSDWTAEKIRNIEQAWGIQLATIQLNLPQVSTRRRETSR
jgi:hypothetical protein